MHGDDVEKLSLQYLLYLKTHLTTSDTYKSVLSTYANHSFS